MAFSGMAAAQTEPECYPVPPGGCETEPPAPQPPPEIDVAADADEEEMEPPTEEPTEPPTEEPTEEPEPEATPAAADEEDEITCEDVIQAIASGDTSNTAMDADGDGDVDVDDLLAAGCTCEEIQEAIAAGDLPADTQLPENCAESAVLADTGIESAGLAGMAAAALLAGAVMVTTTRRRA